MPTRDLLCRTGAPNRGLSMQSHKGETNSAGRGGSRILKGRGLEIV